LKHSIEELKTAVSYDPETGQFRWLISPKYDIPAGYDAGGKHYDGYHRIRYKSVYYQCQRLAYAFMTGDWPPGEMDHINGVRDDNRWANLRAVPKQLNALNRKTYVTNTSGVKGVSWHPKLGKWRVRIQKFGERKALGCFDTLEEAKVAYDSAAEAIFGYHKRAE
jgi:hypothetical protein